MTSEPTITHFEDLDLSRRYTYAEYLTWRFQERVELLRGWVTKMSPAPSLYHQTVASNLYLLIAPHVQRPCKFFFAPFDVRLQRTSGHESVVQPDLCVICDPGKLTERGCDGAPDWIIEILSPGNSKREMRDKYALYEESGVTEYWVVDPLHYSVERYLLTDGSYVRHAPHFIDDEEIAALSLPEIIMSGEAVFER